MEVINLITTSSLARTGGEILRRRENMNKMLTRAAEQIKNFPVPCKKHGFEKLVKPQVWKNAGKVICIACNDKQVGDTFKGGF